LFAISAVSLFVGASLGPSFGIVVSSGGLGAWISKRLSITDTEAKHEYTLLGMAGGLGAIFSGPLFSAVMASELSPIPKRRYVAAFIPELIAATIGYFIYFGITDSVLLDAFEVPGYEYEPVHLVYGVALGIISVGFVLAQVAVSKAVARTAELLKEPRIRAAVFGAVVGLIAFAMPLTATDGSRQLAYETANIAILSIGLLSAVLIGKMVAFALSQGAGFLGGPVFPILFIGGTAGILVHMIVPAIPAPVAVAATIAAVPGAIIGAPVSFILIGAGVAGVGVGGLAPIGMAVITAHLAVWSLKLFSQLRDSV
jgi:H+/Cl- antiporter ClcA